MESQRIVSTLGQFSNMPKSWKYIATAGHHLHYYRYDGRQSRCTYIGVNFDKRHIWKPHFAYVEGKARQKLTTMRKLAETICGG